jgi:hypothetical protein
MSPTSSRYKELGLKLVSLEDKSSRMPKRISMVGEKKDELDMRSFQIVAQGSPHATKEQDDG